MPDDQSLLAGIRVLDLASSRAELAGRLLADLGADVLKIEPPEGADSRRRGPFDQRPGKQGRSLYWAAVGLGKRSAVLDLRDREADRQTLRELALRADVFVESLEPGELDALGLGYGALSALNPRLVYVSVSPFGREGPKSRWPATDLTLEAAGGRVSLQGDRDRPPIPVGYPQAAFHAGARAAADAIIAVNEREHSGLGQHLDTSMQEAIVWTLMNGPGFPPYVGSDPPGSGHERAGLDISTRRGPFIGVSPCSDGFVVVTPTSQSQFLAAVTESILPAVRAGGGVDGHLAEQEWQAWEQARQGGTLSDEQMVAAAELVRCFFLSHTKAELMEWAWKADVHLGPVHTTHDLLDNPHLRERGYWQNAGEYTQPGISIRTSRGAFALRQPAPAHGGQQEAIREWLNIPLQPANPPKRDSERLGEAFAGLKVVDFSWVAVGPLTAKALADHGATVVHVETSTRIDYVRTLVPFKDGVPGVNRSHYFNNLNTSKLGITLNMAMPEGKALARRLADWADVVIENFTPGTMKRLGLDYETLSHDHPDLVMISTCLLGQTGPWASFAGYGPHGAAIAGLHAITGWPDRPPAGPQGPYTDVIAPHYAVSALAAAVLERQRTGRGQHLDISQVESAVHFLEPLLLDETVNGRTAAAAGLDSLHACPHGVYATAGTERYIAIAVETTQQWRALCTLAPLGDFAADRFDDLEQRRLVRNEIDAALSRWTAGFERRELELMLVSAGVPASVVQRMTELHEDPQLAARGYFVRLRHSEIGEIPHDGLITRFSAKQTMLHSASPCLGEHTEQVMREVLGLTHGEIADYAAAGVFS
jgi:crotonobetainyl-CoA:carnitine CoA-transferase CaiB-like acyl-CoA transferase